MKTISLFLTSVFLVFAVQSVAVAQTVDVTKTFKKNFNETVQEVKETESPDEKRAMLNESFSKMMAAIEQIESKAHLSEEESNQLEAYKTGIKEKQDELNGSNGFDKVMDKDLNNFTDYSQQYMEQADKTVTIGVTVAILIIIILLLL